MKTIMISAIALVSIGCATHTSQVTAETPRATMQQTDIEDSNGGTHRRVHINTRKGYQRCLHETGGKIGFCRKEAEEAEYELRFGTSIQQSPAMHQFAGTTLDPYAVARLTHPDPFMPVASLVPPSAGQGQETTDTQAELDIVIQAVDALVNEVKEQNERLAAIEGAGK
jgi:hypothetical protein